MNVMYFDNAVNAWKSAAQTNKPQVVAWTRGRGFHFFSPCAPEACDSREFLILKRAWLPIPLSVDGKDTLESAMRGLGLRT